MYFYSITHEDGTTSTFASSKEFAWAVVVKDTDANVAAHRWIAQPWGVYRKSSTRRGAENGAREASQIKGKAAFERVLIVPLTPLAN
jgi:hypothetical protein